VFLDADLVVEAASDAQQEARLKVLGLIEGRLFAVVYTMRGASCRIISARRTSRSEAKRYGR
jgi:uncharacterized DUF497 family protein